MRRDFSTRENRPENQIIAACLIFAVAFALRTAFALQWADMPYGTAPLLDAEIYDKWAWALAQGRDYGPPAYYQSPLYPWLLSLVYRLCGHSFLAASLFNALIDSVTVVGLAAIANRLFGAGAALVTGLLAAFFAPMIFFAAPVMKEPLALFLMTAFVWAGLTALRKPDGKRFLAAGLLIGLVTLARGNAILLAPVLPIIFWFYKKPLRQFVALGAFYLLGFVLAVSPIAFHNWRNAHDLSFTPYAGGFNLYIGHSPFANGTNAYPPEVATGPDQERIDTTIAAEREAGHPLKPSEISAYWRGKAIDYAIHNPLREAELLGRKFMAFWNGGDSFDNYDPSFIRDHFPSLLNVPLITFGAVSTLAAFAVCGGALRRRPEHFFLLACAAAYMLSVLVFYVTDRYRLPIVVFLLPLAGACLGVAWDKKHLAMAGVGGVVFLALALCPSLSPQNLEAFDWGVLTSIHADKGEEQQALDAFNKAVAISPQLAGVQPYVAVSGIYEKWGQMQQAESILANVAHIFPQDGVVFYNLGRIQAMRGNLDDALASMTKARDLAPGYVLTYYALARLYEKKGAHAYAEAAAQEGLAIDPANENLRQWKQGK